MLLILANRWDESAHSLAARLKKQGGRVLTPRDLSYKGWRQRLGRPADCTFSIEGETFRQDEITGVLTRLPCVYEQELTHIVEPDRAYVAAEMNAFLAFWLTSLRCPVINRPSPGCLNGPAWRPFKWSQLAAQAGFSVPPFDPSAPTAGSIEPEALKTITVLGRKCLGETNPRLSSKARRLAKLAGVDMLTVRLSGRRFQDVSLAPDLSDDAAAPILLDIFSRARKRKP